MNETLTVKEEGITRRQFFGYVWLALVVVFLGETVGALLGSLWPRLKAGVFGAKINAGPVEDFPVGSVTTFVPAKLFLVRLDSGVLAMYRQCPHLGCIVPPWDESKQIFECSCHGSQFNKEGEVLGGPSPRPLDLFTTEIIDGDIVVDTNPRNILHRDHFDESQVTKA